jgi:NADH-quinone oxidoreductase subunit E
MCALTIVWIVVIVVLVRYLWWSAKQSKQNPYMKQGEAKNPTSMRSDKQEESNSTEKDNKNEEPQKQLERIEVDTSHKELVKVEKPTFMEKPQGKKDDLKRISGIGPKIEEGLNSIGIFHYHQIATLTPENIKWIDEHFAFKGRVERDHWIEQAKLLANGEETEFSKRYK